MSQLPPLDGNPDLPRPALHTTDLVDYCPELIILNSNTTMGVPPSLLRSKWFLEPRSSAMDIYPVACSTFVQFDGIKFDCVRPITIIARRLFNAADEVQAGGVLPLGSEESPPVPSPWASMYHSRVPSRL